MKRILRVAAAVLVPAFAATMAVPSQAAITCQKGYQLVNGSPIATPYCQDAYLADVARQYGFKVSAAGIRNNPNVKRHICTFVGQDNRVFLACLDVNSRDGRRN